MLVFGVVCWISEESQLPELKRCLDSIRQFRVILVDGKWYDMEGEQHTSIPEARNLIAKYPNVEVITAVNRHEWENRNLYLERCKEDDMLIWIDTDEYLEVVTGTYDSEIIACRLANIPMAAVQFEGKMHGKDTSIRKRVVISPLKTRHKDRHNELWCDGKEITQGKLPLISGLTIHHDKEYRSDHREKAMFIRNRLKPFR